MGRGRISELGGVHASIKEEQEIQEATMRRTASPKNRGRRGMRKVRGEIVQIVSYSPAGQGA